MLKGKGIIDKDTYEKYLSQRICELTGIKPHYGVYVNFGDLDNNYRLVTNKRKYRLIADVRYYVDSDDDLRNLSPKFLPDFEKNNNFVKLLEIFHKNNFYINDISINCVIEKETFVIYFLKYLIKILTDETISEKVKDVLKQAIKNEQWEISSQ